MMIHRKNWLLALVAGALIVGLTACGGSTVAGPSPTPSPTAGLAPAPTPAQATSTAVPTTVATAAPTKAANTTSTAVVATVTPTKAAASTSTPTSGGPNQIVDIAITTDPYLFIPDSFTFQTGKRYTLRFKEPKEPHTFTVTGLGLDILVMPGQATEKVVTFDDVGKFKLVCTIHEQLKQTGTVTVTRGQ